MRFGLRGVDWSVTGIGRADPAEREVGAEFPEHRLVGWLRLGILRIRLLPACSPLGEACCGRRLLGWSLCSSAYE